MAMGMIAMVKLTRGGKKAVGPKHRYKATTDGSIKMASIAIGYGREAWTLKKEAERWTRRCTRKLLIIQLTRLITNKQVY